MGPTFDVAGNVTLNQVRNPKKGETPEQRNHRLAQKAVIEGVQIFTDRDGKMRATSARRGVGFSYELDLTERTCGCNGFSAHGYCKHLALAMANAEPITCPECNGEGGKRMYGASGWLSDWTWMPCRRCAKVA